MLSFRQIFKQEAQQKRAVYSYTSSHYYEVKTLQHESGWQLTLTKRPLQEPFTKHLEEDLFNAYRAEAEVYIADLDGEEVATFVVEQQAWNNTLLIHDLYVEESYKRRSIGKQTLDSIKVQARERGVRAIIVETQTTNVPAIEFYLKNGFQFIGVNTISYSNSDVANKEVRIEMGFIVEGHV